MSTQRRRLRGERGLPQQRRGVTEVNGLFFLGLHWMYRQPSATLFGGAADAEYLAAHMAGTA